MARYKEKKKVGAENNNIIMLSRFPTHPRDEILEMAKSLQAKIQAEPDGQDIALDIDGLTIFPFRPLQGDQARFEEIVMTAVEWGRKLLNIDAIPPWSAGFSNASSELSIQYFPDHAHMLVSEGVLNIFREGDAVVTGVHEILGHHMQESKMKRADLAMYLRDRRRLQEECAMRCEDLLLRGGLQRIGLEWKLFRVLRALVDTGREELWGDFPEGHRMPLETVREFVQKSPGVASMYIHKHEGENPHCFC